MSELDTAADPGPAGDASFPPVGRAESGQKLLRFLQRRLNLPPALLHRWIRTGQARLNGRRARPFARVAQGDVVRLPPFAATLAAQAGAEARSGEAAPVPGGEDAVAGVEGGAPLPPLLATLGDIWAFQKPAGLPTHPGTGHEDSLATRLAAHARGAAFTPTPAHRLDKSTSGILLVAATYEALRELQQAIRERQLVKEYVAWVDGRWPWERPRLLRAKVCKAGPTGDERMRVCEDGARDGSRPAREALCVVRPLRSGERESLVQIRLITGRTHQIRVQLAALGHAVLGDAKYGNGRREGCPGMRLHALRVVLPDGREVVSLPDWAPPHALDAVPEPVPVPAAGDDAQGRGAPGCPPVFPRHDPTTAAGKPGAPH